MNSITQNDRRILHDLASKMRDYADLPVMEDRGRLWRAHNELRGERPPIVMEIDTFIGDILPPLQCETDAARQIEWQLRYYITNHELVDDDKIVPPHFTIWRQIANRRLGIDMEVRRADASIGYQFLHPVKDLAADLNLLKPSEYNVDRKATLDRQAFVEDAIGDILPTKIKDNSLSWYFCLTAIVVQLMGMERMFTAMLDSPREFHQMMAFLRDDSLVFLKWLEDENLLVLNNDADYTGAGSYGFTNELPQSEQFTQTEKVTSRDIWGNMNSQESVGLSPAMYDEFILPYYCDIAKRFGLVYYGCCEPVHEFWDGQLSELPNLRKVSISAWCDEKFMGERLRGGSVIYSRKPSPNFIGVGDRLDEDAFADHIRDTLTAAKGCRLEIIFRDIYSLNGDRSKPGRAVRIVRGLLDEHFI